MRVWDLGTALGAVDCSLLRREFRNPELGILVWPLTALYLLNFFYIRSFLVLTSVNSWLRYVVVPL